MSSNIIDHTWPKTFVAPPEKTQIMSGIPAASPSCADARIIRKKEPGGAEVAQTGPSESAQASRPTSAPEIVRAGKKSPARRTCLTHTDESHTNATSRKWQANRVVGGVLISSDRKPNHRGADTQRLWYSLSVLYVSVVDLRSHSPACPLQSGCSFHIAAMNLATPCSSFDSSTLDKSLETFKIAFDSPRENSECIAHVFHGALRFVIES